MVCIILYRSCKKTCSSAGFLNFPEERLVEIWFSRKNIAVTVLLFAWCLFLFRFRVFSPQLEEPDCVGSQLRRRARQFRDPLGATGVPRRRTHPGRHYELQWNGGHQGGAGRAFHDHLCRRSGLQISLPHPGTRRRICPLPRHHLQMGLLRAPCHPQVKTLPPRGRGGAGADGPGLISIIDSSDDVGVPQSINQSTTVFSSQINQSINDWQ